MENLVADLSRELLPSSHQTAAINVGHSLYTLKAALCCYTSLLYGLHNPLKLMISMSIMQQNGLETALR